MKKQIRNFFLGLFFLVCAMFSVTLLPPIIKGLKGSIFLYEYVFVEVEFFLLLICGFFWFFSPKLYKSQILSIICAIVFYILFIKIYPFIF